MKTIIIKMFLGIGFGSVHNDEQELQVEDDATKEQIEEEVNEIVNDWAQNYIDLGYSWVAQEGQTNE
ncbi:DUF7167 family protein [Chitinophaga sp. 22536]|uniref:DUF7167 family protein n=1 Tax=unclassified Chitinophaga TaxID=2619133 RepID=UPI003F82BDB6